MSNTPEELFALHGKVEELQIDEEFSSHMALELRQYGKHLVSAKELRQVHAKAPKYFENEGKAPVVMVGPTESGRIVAIPIEPTHANGVWRPITAFEANAHHRERYEGRGQ